jgi:hypothetical protein
MRAKIEHFYHCSSVFFYNQLSKCCQVGKKIRNSEFYKSRLKHLLLKLSPIVTFENLN